MKSFAFGGSPAAVRRPAFIKFLRGLS